MKTPAAPPTASKAKSAIVASLVDLAVTALERVVEQPESCF
jgi:hypothetical protein